MPRWPHGSAAAHAVHPEAALSMVARAFADASRLGLCPAPSGRARRAPRRPTRGAAQRGRRRSRRGRQGAGAGAPPLGAAQHAECRAGPQGRRVPSRRCGAPPCGGSAPRRVGRRGRHAAVHSRRGHRRRGARRRGSHRRAAAHSPAPARGVARRGAGGRDDGARAGELRVDVRGYVGQACPPDARP
eukprot:3078958-Prymnesium_polylepis.1